MKYVDSGSGKIPLLSLIAILSISLTVNLPGLAISPIMGKLDTVFHHVTELEIQLLTVLPNLVTIPFILCSGKLSTQKNQMVILGIGLGLYALTGVLYFFATTMVQLIVLSCLLGVGCGLVIPLAASLISQNFAGSARTKQLGMKSSLSNFSVILATLFVGWVAAIDWHYAFIVYMIPIIPLCLLPFMSNKFIADHRIEASDHKVLSVPKTPATPVKAVKTSLLVLGGIMALYFIMTYAIEVVSYYLPFSMEHYNLNTDDVGVATAMFFAAATAAGFFLTKILKVFKGWTMAVAIILCIAGLFGCGLLHHYWSFIVGVLLMGIGYGVIQPVIYDKTSCVAPTAEKSTEYFVYLLTCNYIGISLVPFIVSGLRNLFHAHGDVNFAFIANAFITVIVLVIAVWKRKSFVFNTEEQTCK